MTSVTLATYTSGAPWVEHFQASPGENWPWIAKDIAEYLISVATATARSEISPESQTRKRRRSPQAAEKLRRLVGVFEGPGDLSENLDFYLYGIDE